MDILFKKISGKKRAVVVFAKHGRSEPDLNMQEGEIRKGDSTGRP